MATLYQIEKQIMECVDRETGEILDAQRLAGLQMERDKKIENVALWYKNLKADAEAYKAEKQTFEQKQKACESKAEQLKQWLASVLDGEKYKTTKVTLSWLTSHSVQVTDLQAIAPEYFTYKEPEPDKNKIKLAIKQGIPVNGVQMETKKNLQIK